MGALQHNLKYYNKTGNLGKKLTRNERKYKNGQKYYPDYPLYGRNIKMAYVVKTINGKIWNQGI